jgi:hypothetical protein
MKITNTASKVSRTDHRHTARLRRTITAYGLIFASMSGQLALADGYSGDDFRKDCIQYAQMKNLNGDFSARNAGYCLGYFTGVLENSTGFCLPPQLVKRQLYLGMKRFIEDYPELLELEAATVIQRYLKQAYPCQKAPVKK